MKKSQRSASNKSQMRAVVNSVSIPSFVPDTIFTQKVRYYVNEAAATDVINFVRELPIIPFGVSISATSLLLLLKAVRVSKIEMWCPYRSGLGVASNTINLTFVERRGVNPKEISSSATPLAPGHIKMSFDKDNYLGWYYLTTAGESNPEIRFQMPKSAILEITYNYIMHDSESVSAVVGSSLTFYRVYTNNLDSNVLVIGKGYQAVINQ